MRYSALLLVLLSVLSISCEDNGTAPIGTFGIRVLFASGFQDDSVTVGFNHEPNPRYFRLSSSPSDSLAGSFQTSFADGSYAMSVSVHNQGVYKDTTFFNRASNFYIVVSYDRAARQLVITMSTIKPLNWTGPNDVRANKSLNLRSRLRRSFVENGGS